MKTPAETNTEPFVTVRKAADTLNIPYWKIVGAVRDGSIPYYTLKNSRRYVLVSEILKVMGANPALEVVHDE